MNEKDRDALLETMTHFAEDVMSDMIKMIAAADASDDNPVPLKWFKWHSKTEPIFKKIVTRQLKDWSEYLDTVPDLETLVTADEDGEDDLDEINHSNPYAEYLEIKKGELRPNAAEWVRYKDGDKNLNYGKYLQFVKTIALSGIDESLADIANYLNHKDDGEEQ